jgi:XTP/dITP diphosphohydrolase
VKLLVLSGTDRLPPGVLPAAAWAALRTAVLLVRTEDHPQRAPLAAAGVAVETAPPDLPGLLDRLGELGAAVWLAAGAETELQDRLAGHGVACTVLDAAALLPGARLLDVVATMDRLRSPGGCPWDAEQTHRSLAPYLLEEAYEAVEAIEDDDLRALREELGDVLLQVAFHARLAAEAPPRVGFTIDDVAADLVAKLVRRHPHVFADAAARSPAEVVVNWERIKATEKGRRSVTEGMPRALPALTYADRLQRKAAGLGVPPDLIAPRLAAAETPAAAVAGLAAEAEAGPGDSPDDSPEAVAGELLFTTVAMLRARGVDPEAALRRAATGFRNRLATAESAAEAADALPDRAGEGGWTAFWPK